jgi:hypothetical protein
MLLTKLQVGAPRPSLAAGINARGAPCGIAGRVASLGGGSTSGIADAEKWGLQSGSFIVFVVMEIKGWQGNWKVLLSWCCVVRERLVVLEIRVGFLFVSAFYATLRIGMARQNILFSEHGIQKSRSTSWSWSTIQRAFYGEMGWMSKSSKFLSLREVTDYGSLLKLSLVERQQWRK